MQHERVSAPPALAGVPTPPDLGDYNLVSNATITVDVRLINMDGRGVWAGPIQVTVAPLALGKLVQDAGCSPTQWNEAKGGYLRPVGALAFDTNGSNSDGAPSVTVLNAGNGTNSPAL